LPALRTAITIAIITRQQRQGSDLQPLG